MSQRRRDIFLRDHNEVEVGGWLPLLLDYDTGLAELRSRSTSAWFN